MDIKRKIKQAANIMGIEKLRKSQVKPINDILEGRDTMVVARPSAGKSAIYQIPALVHGEERTIVIEPLLSLMHDQVRKLRELLLPEAEAGHFVYAHAQRAGGSEALLVGRVPLK